jgi:hypothetical protein
MTEYNHRDDETLTDNWKKRFDFFKETGGLKGKAYTEKMKSTKFMGRIFYLFNFYAFFFGPIYFCMLGLWKKALTLIVLALIVVFILELFFGIFASNNTGFGAGFCMLFSMTANYSYYLKKTTGRSGWNPFEGMI